MTQPDTAKSTTSSAPSYEPDKWNDKNTPADVSKFYQENNDIIVRLRAQSMTGWPPTADSMAKARDVISSPADQDAVTKAAPDSLARLSEKLGSDDAKVAEALGIEAKDVAGIRERFDAFGEKQGYQRYANCYTYAMDDLDGTKSPDRNFQGDNPGQRQTRSLIQPSDIAAEKGDYEAYKKALMDEIVADGATYGGADAPPKQGHYRVGVYAMPPEKMSQGDRDNGGFTDMHFVRENKEGGWSHKPGREAVTDKDKDGRPITDPKTANLGGYDFLGYVYVPEGGLDVGRYGEPKTKPGSPEVKTSQQSSMDDKAEWLKSQLAEGVVGRVSNEKQVAAANTPSYAPAPKQANLDV